ncbi:MAG: histidinol-phosphate transaminase [Oscillospiraceae bacterium]|nr:histidinol-phosphate transaminase [Oscillospiraceae bacterium]MBR2977956.1 histidinol-phosphate transaminase [Oscillospiraceae bacterium]MBR3850117.1 histidinol-phosphate transaminase [Oscillospiraceae bacterium]
MSGFFSKKYASLEPYTPGEQPNDMRYNKLNTNESPYPPSGAALRYAAECARTPNLYPKPDDRELAAAFGALYGLSADETLLTNGSDEGLNFAFMSYCDDGAAFPDISYGFYSVFAELNGVAYTEIPLREDFSVDVSDYFGLGKTIFIANPNAPTGLLLPLGEIERLVSQDPDHIVLIDEAYIDFGGESAAPLVKKYKNLLVTQTFSKSRSMAGSRLGAVFGCRERIAELNAIKFSTNPYNVNSYTAALGLGVLNDPEYTKQCCAEIQKTRAYTVERLREMGFTVLDSKANFVFAKTEKMDGGALYEELKRRGVLVRHFDKARIREYNRITIGTREQMDAFFDILTDILEGK